MVYPFFIKNKIKVLPIINITAPPFLLDREAQISSKVNPVFLTITTCLIIIHSFIHSIQVRHSCQPPLISKPKYGPLIWNPVDYKRITHYLQSSPHIY